MSTNPTNATRMMFVNCHVNLTPTTHFVQPLPPGARSITCDVCKAIILVLDHNPLSALPRQHSPKKAVICGISYQKSSHKLKGSINDAKCMKDLLVDYFGFKETDIVMLTDEKTDQLKTPTKYNLMTALYWLGDGCQPGDSLVFHYSGHGLRLRNYRLREVGDGYNETLCPMDFETEGMIFDDEINRAIVEHLPRKVKLHAIIDSYPLAKKENAIIDSCHRESVLDLRFHYRKNSRSGQYKWENPRPNALKGTSGGDAISFSRSVEVRTTADTPLLSKTTSTDSMTSCFIKAIKDGRKQKQKLTYWSILDSMQNKKTGGNLQEPLLSACGQFVVNSPFTL